MDIFTSREVSTGIWLIIIIIPILVILRARIKDLLKSFFHYKILIPIFIMLLYLSGIVYFLFILELWNLDLLKDTIIWVFFVGLLMLFKYSTSNDKVNFPKEIIIDNMRLLIIFEFIVNTYSFPLYIEIFLVPLVSFFVLIGIVANRSPKYIKVSKLINIIQIIIGLFILGYSIFRIILDFEQFASLKTLKDFLLAPILTLFTIPFIYCFLLYINYENVFIRLELGRNKEKGLKRYAKMRIIRFCKCKISRIKIILKLKTNELMKLRNEKEVDLLIESLKIHNNEIDSKNFGHKNE